MAGSNSSRRSSRKRAAAQPVEPEDMDIMTAKDAEEALVDNQARSLAVFFRGLMPPTAIHAGPQHVCLKRAFSILENRWKMDAAEGSDFLATSGQGPLAFGQSSLSPELFISVFDFLGPQQAMRSGQTCKDWWRSVSALPDAAHIDLTTLRSSSTKLRRLEWGGMSLVEAIDKRTSLTWQDLLTHLRYIKKTNPRRVVRRLTFNGNEKLGSLSNLSSATAGLLTHIDFSRSRREIDFEQLGVNLPGLRGLAVPIWYYMSPAWVNRLTKLMSTVSLESLRVCARAQFDNSCLAAFAGGGDALLSLTLVARSSHGEDLEEGMSALGAAAPRLRVLTIDQLRVTNNGWNKFATARLAAERRLTSIRIKAVEAALVPSRTVRSLLVEATTESLWLYAKVPASLVDCDGSPVAGAESEKLRVTSAGPWGATYKATDL